MPKIRASVAPAHRAIALRVDRALVFYIARVLDQHASFAGVEASVSRRARREHTIHHVNASRHVVRDLLRPAYSHQVARFFPRQQFGYDLRHLASDFMRLADRETTHCIAGKFDLKKLPSALLPQIRKRRALHDAELPLSDFPIALRLLQEILSSAPRPLSGAL